MKKINVLLLILFNLFFQFNGYAKNGYFPIINAGYTATKWKILTGDSLVDTFFEMNTDALNVLSMNFSKLPINKCHQQLFIFNFKIDSTGKIVFAELLDTSAINTYTLQKALEAFKSVNSWKFTNGFEGKLAIKINDIENKSQIYRSEQTTNFDNGRLNQGSITTTTNGIRQWTEVNKNCSDADYFFNEGVKKFNESEFKKATYFFIQAYNANPFDVDILYNLGASYLKMEKKEKAKYYLEFAALYGDEKSQELINKFLMDVQSKK